MANIKWRKQIKIALWETSSISFHQIGGKLLRHLHKGWQDSAYLYPQNIAHENRKVVADSQPYKWLSLSQSLWRAYHHKRYITAVEELCREVWLKRESGFPSLFPPSLCQEFLGEVQRHRIACRPHGTWKHRDNTYLSAKEYFSLALEQCQTKVAVCGSITDEDLLQKNLTMNCIPSEVFKMDHNDYVHFLEDRRLLMANKIRKYYDSL